MAPKKIAFNINSQLKPFNPLRLLNPSPHMDFMKFDDQVIIGASPELLFRLRNGEMETFPLAGTTKRGKSKSEDLKLARELIWKFTRFQNTEVIWCLSGVNFDVLCT